MNAKQIYKEVAALTSEGCVENREGFWASLNLALAEVGRIDPVKQYLTVGHFPPPAVYRLPKPCTVTSDAPLTVSALTSAAIALSGFGSGKLSLFCDGAFVEEKTLSGDGFTYRRSVETLCGKACAEVTLVLTSTGEMVLDSLILYERMGKESEAEIPLDGSYTVYAADRLAEDFGGFSGDILKKGSPSQTAPKEVILNGNSLMIANGCRGVYEVGYFRAPVTVTEDNSEEELDVKKECEHLLPYLTAYYCCLEDDDPRAEDFLGRYREAREFYEKRRVPLSAAGVEDRYGW